MVRSLVNMAAAPCMAICMAVFFTSCSDDKTLSLDSGGSADASAFTGSWERPCAASGAEFAKVRYIFNAEGTVTKEQRFYSDATCTDANLRSLWTENVGFWVARKLSETEQKFAINMQSQSLTITPKAAQADTWSKTGFCESADWKTDVAYDRTNKACHGVSLFFDLAKIENNVLFFGSKTGGNNGLNNDDRPLIYETTGYTKI
jgi:hypothetical protein